MEFVAVRFDGVVRQRDDLAQHGTRRVGRSGQRNTIRKPDRIQIHVACQAVCIADAVTGGIFNVDEYFSGVCELVARIES
jgi:hypothetical protein